MCCNYCKVIEINRSFKILAISSFLDPKPAMLQSSLTEMPHCWTVVTPERSLSRHVEVLVAVGETSMF
jgi:vacuolar protein sorting-associated protein 16